MGVDTKAILRKGTTLAEIKERLESKYGEVLVYTTHSNDFFQLSFKEPQEIKVAASHRCLSVSINECAKLDYGIDGVLVSLSTWGSNIEIMRWLLDEFGGYLDENDCDDEWFYPVNIEAFEKVKDISLKEVNEKLRSAAPELLNIAKRVAFIFDNEANYPKGTIGYELAQDAKAAIKKATE